jgi:hypothetical protein
MEFVKNTGFMESSLYHSLKNHPSFLEIKNSKLNWDTTSIDISLPTATKTDPYPPFERLNEYMRVVLEGFLTLEKAKIVYGDCKIENIVEMDGSYKIIDMDICHFLKVGENAICQTYEDEMHQKMFENVDFEGYYDTKKELVWSIGFLLRSVLEKKQISSKKEYEYFLKNPKMSKNTPPEWTEFQKICFKPQLERCGSVEELIKYSPVEIRYFPIEYFDINEKGSPHRVDLLNRTEVISDVFSEMIEVARDKKLLKLIETFSLSFWDDYFSHIDSNDEKRESEYVAICFYIISEFHQNYENSLDSIIFYSDIENKEKFFGRVELLIKIMNNKIPSLLIECERVNEKILR